VSETTEKSALKKLHQKQASVVKKLFKNDIKLNRKYVILI